MAKIKRVIVKRIVFRPKMIVVYAILLQGITAAFLLINPDQLLVARLGIFYELFPNHYVGATTMIVSVILSCVGLTKIGRDKFLYHLPQLVFLLLTAGSSLRYVLLGHYADGVIRPWPFIFVDQLPAFVMALIYTYSIFDFKEYE